MKGAINKIIFLLVFYNLMSGCTEPYALQTNTFDDAIVVEATITNEFKKQQIKITRTYRFEDNGPSVESGAEVYITDDQGIRYDFEESDGVYVSTVEFQAIPARTYHLTINTSSGKSYRSSPEALTVINEIQDIVPTVKTKNGVRGVEINVKSFDPIFTSKYYRYEYEETYKILTPNWNSLKAIVNPGLPHGTIELIPRDDEEIRTCFSTVASIDILQTTTNELSEDRINFPVRFISDQNSIIMNRYSILVRQYIQNAAAYTFYKTLRQLSGSESILSQNQPGFFYGNMRSVDNPNEKVIGFFEVSSVSSKRIFFNFTDLFPGEPLPPYFVDCAEKEFKFCFISTDPECRGGALLSAINSNSLLYAGDNNELYYYMVLPACGDCTTFSSNIRPSFWED